MVQIHRPPQVSSLHASSVHISPAHGGMSRSVLTICVESKMFARKLHCCMSFLSPWHMNPFNLHCNCFSSIEQSLEGSAGFWQSHCASVSCGRLFLSTGVRQGRKICISGGCLDTHWGLSFLSQTNIPWKQHVSLASSHPHTISTILALFDRMHGNTLKVFKMWQIGQ